MANFTKDGNSNSKLNNISKLPASIAVIFLASNIFLSITATLGNALILIALRKVSSVHPPTKLLFRCLAVTDLCVGLISQPLFAILSWDVVIKINFGIIYRAIVDVSSFIFCGVSIFTSTAISVDRLLALLLGLRYRHVVTLRRVRAAIACFWLIPVSGIFVYLLAGIQVAYKLVIIFIILSVVISVFSYTKIFLRLRQHQIHVQENVHQGQPNGGGIPLNIARYKKTVSSIAWIQLAIVACYVPVIISVIVVQISGGWSNATLIVWNITTTLLYLNSSLNPFLYYYKIVGARQAVKGTIRQFFCCLN